jgi:hypothetical protein
MLCRSLQHAQAHFGAVVCAQAFSDESRQKDLGLSQLFDDARFHGVSSLVNARKLAPRRDADIASNHSWNRHK